MLRLQRGCGTFDPTFGLSAEHPRSVGQRLRGRVTLAENGDLKSHHVIAFGRLDWLQRRQDAFNGWWAADTALSDAGDRP